MRKSMVWPSGILALLASTALLVAGCTSSPGAGSSSTPPSATPSSASAADEPTPAETGAAPDGPVEAFQVWLAASREPDTETACGMMTDALVDRMIAELAASGVSVADCPAMISSTAALYESLGVGADVAVTVQEETADTATLFVVYTDGGDCGTAVMQRDASAGWVITELSEECATGS